MRIICCQFKELPFIFLFVVVHAHLLEINYFSSVCLGSVLILSLLLNYLNLQDIEFQVDDIFIWHTRDVTLYSLLTCIVLYEITLELKSIVLLFVAHFSLSFFRLSFHFWLLTFCLWYTLVWFFKNISWLRNLFSFLRFWICWLSQIY